MNKSENKNQLETLQELAHIGLWEFNLITQTLTWSNEIFNIFELDKNKFNPTYENFFDIVHPEDKKSLNDIYLNSYKQNKNLKLPIDY